MSTARDRERRRHGGRGHLVLLRGGLDHEGAATMGGSPEDADWQAFCERIGWQHVEAALPDDYEERLAARIFQDAPSRWGRERPHTPGSCGALGDDPVSIGVERAQRVARLGGAEPTAGGDDEGWPLSGAVAPWQSKARRAYVVATTMAVAAVLGVAASVMFWLAGRPSVGAVACPDAEALPRATIAPVVAPIVAPVVDRAEPVEPSERRRDPVLRARPPQVKDATTGPAPSEAKPRRPTPPGSMVAQRSASDDERPREPSQSVTMGPQAAPYPGPAEPALVGMGETVQPVQARERALDAPPLAVALADGVLAPTLPVIPRAWPSRPAMTMGPRAAPYPAPAEPASLGQAVVPASATWSLSPESPRWYGVGLPPSSASAGVPSGVGVMAQVDLAKVIDAL
jgi:hypothetical protein